MAWYNPFTWKSENNSFFNPRIYGSKDVPLWLDVNIQKYEQIYLEVPHVRIVIDQLASMFSNGKFVIKDSKGEVIDNQEQNEVYKLLKNPNPLQSGEEFLMQMFIYQALYGTAFNNKLQVGTSLPRVMYNLPSQHVQTILTGKIFKQVEKDQIIQKYVLDKGDGTSEDYETNDVLLTTTPSPDNPILGTSKIKSLQKPISNITAVLSKSNMILNKMGAVGILSNEGNTDGMGAVPLTPNEKKEVHDQYQSNYGHESNKMGIVISEANLKWQSMSYPTKDLMLYEELESDFAQIISMYGASRDMFPSTKGATFENQKEAERSTYNNTIIPFASNYARSLTEFLGVEGKFIIELDYSHLAVLQENQLEKSQVLVNTTNAVQILSSNGIGQDVIDRLLEGL